jgi:hypothetical protein
MKNNVHSFSELCKGLPQTYLDEVISNAPWEMEFRNEEKHWYSPFILWSEKDVVQYQPDYDSDFSGYLAIGSNGGMETYLINLTDYSIWVADLVAGSESLEKVAISFEELNSQLEKNE